MMLGNMDYDNVFLSYNGNMSNKVVLYALFFAYALLMPIIFLNLLVCVYLVNKRIRCLVYLLIF